MYRSISLLGGKQTGLGCPRARPASQTLVSPVMPPDPDSQLDTLFGDGEGQGQGRLCLSLYHMGSFLSGPLNWVDSTCNTAL